MDTTLKLNTSRAGENGSEAWVTRVYEPGEMPRLQLGYADSIDLSKFKNDQFVQVREPHGRRMDTVIAHVTYGMQVKTRDEDEIEPARCRKGVMPKAGRSSGRRSSTASRQVFVHAGFLSSAACHFALRFASFYKAGIRCSSRRHGRRC